MQSKWLLIGGSRRAVRRAGGLRSPPRGPRRWRSPEHFEIVGRPGLTERDRFATVSSVLTAIVIGLHVFVAFGLIFLVLLHSGRGGGLSDMFGGGLGASAAGSTVVEKNLDRLTIIGALVFVFTTIALALMLDAGR